MRLSVSDQDGAVPKKNGMDLKTMEWVVLGLRKEVETLQMELKKLRNEVSKNKLEQPIKSTSNDELLNTKEVLNYLGICYNTLQSIIKKGLITPIRINQRRVKFSKLAILAFINQQQIKPT